MPVNIEYGYQPFIIIRPLRFLQVGVKMDYAFSNLAIITEGKIDQIDLNANIQQTGQNTAVGTANVGFSFFEELSAKVKMTVYRQQAQYFKDAPVPENQKLDPGAGIRYNG